MSWNANFIAPTARPVTMYEKNKDDSSASTPRSSISGRSSQRRPSTALASTRSSTHSSSSNTKQGAQNRQNYRSQTPVESNRVNSDFMTKTRDILMEASGTAMLTARGAATLSVNNESGANEDQDEGNGAATRFRTDEVIIHVFDEARNAKRDFYCKKALLLQEMKYFTSYFSEKASGTVSDPLGVVDIDVHCDVEVFEWLMAYIVKKESKLEPRSAVSILISSHFLHMQALEDTCIRYIHQHINQIIQIPIDLKCINKNLMTKLAALFSEEELVQVVDPKDKIRSQLFLHKLSHLLSAPEAAPRQKQPIFTPHGLTVCTLCGKLYSLYKEDALVCEKASVSISFRGELRACHQPDMNFDINEYIARVYGTCQSWEKVFWCIWGTLSHLSCTTCGMLFPIMDIKSCRKHGSDPIYPNKSCLSEENEGKGFYRCCVETPTGFSPFQIWKGCQICDHIPDVATSDTKVIKLLESYPDRVFWYYEDLYILKTVLKRGIENISLEKRRLSLTKSIEDGQVTDPSHQIQSSQFTPIFATWKDAASMKFEASSLYSSTPSRRNKQGAKFEKTYIQRDKDATRLNQILEQISSLRASYFGAATSGS